MFENLISNCIIDMWMNDFTCTVYSVHCPLEFRTLEHPNPKRFDFIKNVSFWRTLFIDFWRLTSTSRFFLSRWHLHVWLGGGHSSLPFLENTFASPTIYCTLEIFWPRASSEPIFGAKNRTMCFRLMWHCRFWSFWNSSFGQDQRE